MAANFRVLIHRKGDSLHLKLYGDFDGTSAFELARAVRKNGFGVSKIFVHTEGLKDVFPFGCDVFQCELPIPAWKSATFVFTGKDAQELAPPSCNQVMVV
jgi:hypothetical protein